MQKIFEGKKKKKNKKRKKYQSPQNLRNFVSDIIAISVQ